MWVLVSLTAARITGSATWLLQAATGKLAFRWGALRDLNRGPRPTKTIPMSTLWRRTPHKATIRAKLALAQHQCLHQRSPSSGRIRPWPFARGERQGKIVLPERVSATAVDPLIALAIEGMGIACLPPFAIRGEIADGRLVSILDEWVSETDQFNVLWPASRQITPKLRAFVDFMAEHLQPQ